ncbi:MFS transporter [Micromonosporaceae bacterium B7E4]
MTTTSARPDTDRVSVARRLIVEQRLRGTGRRSEAGIGPRPPGEPVPLSPAQHGLWVVDQLLRDKALYGVYDAVRLRGPLDVLALRGAFDALAERHEVLRTVFVAEGEEPVQRVLPPDGTVFAVVDVAAEPPSNRDDAATEVIESELATGFDPAVGPLTRVLMVRLADEEYMLLVHLHHIVAHEWSCGVLAPEVSELYRANVEGRAARLDPPPIQFADCAYWLAQRLSPARIEAELTWMNPFELAFTVDSLWALAERCGLEAETPCVNRFDISSDSYNWELPFTDPELCRRIERLDDRRRWQLGNLLLLERSPMLWFYLGRSGPGRPRGTEAERNERFLDTVVPPGRRRAAHLDPARWRVRPAGPADDRADGQADGRGGGGVRGGGRDLDDARAAGGPRSSLARTGPALAAHPSHDDALALPGGLRDGAVGEMTASAPAVPGRGPATGRRPPSDGDDRGGRLRLFRVVAAAYAVSVFGGFFNLVAVNLYAYQLTGSALAVGSYLAARLGAGFLAGGPAGWASTRFDRRRVMVAGDAAQAIAMVSLVVTPTRHHAYLLWAVAVLLGAGNTTRVVAVRTSVPDVVRAADRVRANGYLVVGRSVAMVLGFACAGSIVAGFGSRVAFGVTAAGFLTSALVMAWLRLPALVEPGGGEPAEPGGDGEPAERGGEGGESARPRRRVGGLRVLLRCAPLLAGLVALRGVEAWSSASHNVALPIVAGVAEAGNAAAFLGQFWTAWAVGGLVAYRAAVWYRGRADRSWDERWYALGVCLTAPTVVAAFTGPPTALLLILALAAGFADGIAEISYATRLQAEPKQLCGALFGLSATAETAGFGVGAMTGALLLERFAALPVVAAFHGIALVAAGGFVVLHNVRSRRPAGGEARNRWKAWRR